MNTTASVIIQNIQPKTSKIEALRPSSAADTIKCQVTYEADRVNAARLRQVDNRILAIIDKARRSVVALGI